MKISAIETVLIGAFPNMLYLRVHTDEGITGLGETFLGARAVAAWIHETAAPYLLGQDPQRIERHWQLLRGFVGANSTGAESRGRSAIDLALWDITGQAVDRPITALLGGQVRDAVRLYNTCAGYRYARDIPYAGLASSRNWQIPDEPEGPYEDMDAFLHRADELAQSLLDEGIGGMKMWPFDPLAEATDGRYVRADELDAALEPFRRIRSAVGDAMEIMVDLHTNWDVGPARQIAAALEPFRPAWIEDPVRPDDATDLAAFTRSTPIPVTGGETLGTRWPFRTVLEERALDIVMFDPVWTGGISESRRIASLAEAFGVPVTVHDCNGPLQFSVGVALTSVIPNAHWQEFVRAYHASWYQELVTDLPRVDQGHATPLPGPGLGTTLRPEILRRPDVEIQTSRA